MQAMQTQGVVTLTTEQQRIVQHDHGPALVFAVAGAGKTTAMVHRIHRLVQQGVHHPKKILATSFSRLTVGDIRRALGGLGGLEEVEVRTLHSLSYRILRASPLANIYNLGDEGADQDDAAPNRVLSATLRTVRRSNSPLKQFVSSFDQEDFLNYVSVCKGNLRFADLAAENLPPNTPASQATAPNALPWYLDLFNEYESTRRKENILTYDDLLVVAWKLLVTNPQMAQTVGDWYQSVMVDEYQDVNLVQSELIDLVSAPHRNLMAIGDDDQTIYEWRGASPRFILDFTKRYGATTYYIQDSFRSPATQLFFANRVVAQNRQRQPKTMSLTKGFEGQLFLNPYQSSFEQASAIKHEVELLRGKGESLQDMVILIRSYAQTPPIEQVLTEAGIPHRVYGDAPFYRRKEVRVMLSYLELGLYEQRFAKGEVLSAAELQDYRDLWFSVYSQPNRYMSQDDAARVLQAVVRGSSLAVALSTTIFKSYVYENVKPLIEVMHWLAQAEGSAWQVLLELEQKLGYKDYLRKSSQNETAWARVGNVDSFLEFARDKGSPAELIAYIKRLASVKVDDSQDHLAIMTIHRSKGLEWTRVFVPDLNAKVYPHSASTNLEEERRLFYVALTRSKAYTYLSLVRALSPSPYLREGQLGPVRERVERVALSLGNPSALSAAQVQQLKADVEWLNMARYMEDWWPSSPITKRLLARKVLHTAPQGEATGPWLTLSKKVIGQRVRHPLPALGEGRVVGVGEDTLQIDFGQRVVNIREDFPGLEWLP